MRLTSFTVGSRGDVQPYVALGRGLARAGYDVTIATHEPFRDFVTSRGLDFAPLPGDPRAMLETSEAQEMLRSGTGIIAFARRFVSLLEPWFWDLVDAVTPIHRRSDAVLYSPLAFVAWHLAQVDRTPTILTGLQPLAPTGSFPAITARLPDLGSIGNRLSHLVNQQLFWQPLRPAVDEWRRRDLGLPAHGMRGPYAEVAARGERQLYGFSRHLVAPPEDWPHSITVTGPWLLDTEEPLDGEIEAFLGDGPPPVYVGFGSTRDRQADELSRLAIEATEATGQRLVLASGWSEMEPKSDDRVLVIDEADHLRLFPRTSGVVHHGGAGTTHTALASGVPSLVVPYYADQPFWGRRLHSVGAGPPPLRRSDLTADRLAARLRMFDHQSLVDRSRRLGRAVVAEAGVERAVAEITRTLERGAPGRAS